MKTLDRLAALKEGTAPYCQLAPIRDRNAEIEFLSAQLRDLRARGEPPKLPSKMRLRRAAKALLNVYGPPPGDPAIQTAIRRAKALARAGHRGPDVLFIAARDQGVDLAALAHAVLSMRGAEVACDG